jgi:hypothetical protein
MTVRMDSGSPNAYAPVPPYHFIGINGARLLDEIICIHVGKAVGFMLILDVMPSWAV